MNLTVPAAAAALRAAFLDRLRGEAPGDFWKQPVAQVGSRFDLARVERVRLGTDGGQYVNGAAAMPFADVAGFRVDVRYETAGEPLGW